MEQQNTISEQITKEEKRNIYLSELLKSLQEKLIKAKSSHKEFPVEGRAELEISQMKNIEKRIEIYKKELEKLKNVSTASVVEQLNKLRAQIISKQQMRDDVNNQLKTLQEAVSKLKARNLSKEKNIEMKQLYGERQYEIKLLHQRLKALQNEESSHSFKMPSRKTTGSATLIPLEKETRIKVKQEGQKKGKIDKFAMYKNLIRFYAQQETKIKTEIEQLSKQAQDNKKIGENIQFYQEKIAFLSQKK